MTPLAEQHRIVAQVEVEHPMALVDKLETLIAATLPRHRNEALLTEFTS